MPSRHTMPMWQNLKVPRQYQVMITLVEIHQKVCFTLQGWKKKNENVDKSSEGICRDGYLSN